MVTEQLVYFTGMTCTQSSGFGDEKLIPFFFFNLIWMVFYLLCFVLIMPASAFVVIFAFFPLVFVVAIHSFRTYGHELPPYIVFIRHFCFFVNMNCTAPHTLAYGFHLIGDPD